MTGTRRLLIYGLPALIVGVMWWSMSWSADAATIESSAGAPRCGSSGQPLGGRATPLSARLSGRGRRG